MTPPISLPQFAKLFARGHLCAGMCRGLKIVPFWAALLSVVFLDVARVGAAIIYEPYAISTLAGSAGVTGSANGAGSAARFNAPWGTAMDNAGNIYVADSFNHTIRKITPAGVVSTLAGLAQNAGSNDGVGDVARFAYPRTVAIDGAGNLYVADTYNHTIRKITPDRTVTTVAGVPSVPGSNDGPSLLARFNTPYGVAVDGANNVYVADTFNQTIRKITPSGSVITLAGGVGSKGSTDGSGEAARFSTPAALGVDNGGNLYVADRDNCTIRKITPAGLVSTFAGAALDFDHIDGPGDTARFGSPQGIAVDSAGNVYVADTYNDTIRRIKIGRAHV